MNPKSFDELATEAHQFLNQKGERMPNTGGWQDRHLRACSWAGAGAGAQVYHMLRHWAQYAECHYDRFGELIAEDYVLGDYWLRMGKGLKGLLDGETGHLDCGTVHGLILSVAKQHGFNEEDL